MPKLENGKNYVKTINIYLTPDRVMQKTATSQAICIMNASLPYNITRMIKWRKGVDKPYMSRLEAQCGQTDLGGTLTS